MVIALTLLLVTLGFVLYHDRDFWFPDSDDTAQEAAEEQPREPAAAVPAARPAQQISRATTGAVDKKRRHATRSQPKNVPVRAFAADSSAPVSSAPVSSAPVSSDIGSSAAPVTATMERTVLPPLEVEVVAGDIRSTVRSGSNSVRVDLQPGSPPQHASEAPDSSEAAAKLTHNAAERVQMSADTSEVVTHSVKPGYPLLARQMKVQGSVVLQALIGRDGLIQDLRVLSGPPILASAAQEAVKQWHFKPHHLGAETVETEATITVNFTISTN